MSDLFNKYSKVELVKVIFVLSTFMFLCLLFLTPQEDAAILFQYSQNLAETGEITYNKFGERAEGATDFLWMVFIAMGVKMGFEAYFMAILLSTVAIFSSAIFLNIISNDRISLFSATLILLFFPGLTAAAQGFSNVFFGCFIIGLIFSFLKKFNKTFYVLSLLACLVRPDGVVFVIAPIIFLITQSNAPIKEIKKFLIIFFIPGVSYFLWRWSYFDLFLPLPFYVKSGSPDLFFIHTSSLKENLFFLISFLPTIVLLLKNKQDVIKNLILFLFPAIIFYSSMHLSQNIGYRFQHALGIVLVTLTIFYVKNLKIRFWILQFSFLVPILTLNYINLVRLPSEHIKDLSLELGTLSPENKMLVTEAGRLSYYSKWYVEDALGLNTKKYARKGISSEDLLSTDFDLIVIHDPRNNHNSDLNYHKFKDYNYEEPSKWLRMVNSMYKGIDNKKYRLFKIPYNDLEHPTYVYTNRIKAFLKGLILKEEVKSNHRYDSYFVKNNPAIIEIIERYNGKEIELKS